MATAETVANNTATITEAPARRDYAALEARVIAAAQPPLSWRVYGQQVSPDGAERYNLLRVHIPAAQPPSTHGSGQARRFHVLLNGGTHGDEPAGAEAATRFLEDRRYERWPRVEFTVTPCTNPWGYVHNRREGPGGLDLNRSFRRAGKATPEISLLKRALARRTFDLFVDCHEDVDAPGLYVFAPTALGRAIVAAVRPVGPVHPGPDVDGEIPLDEGVVVLDSPRVLAWRRGGKTWPLPYYVGRFHQRPMPALGGAGAGVIPDAENVRAASVPLASQATVETPTCLPLDQRVAMHHAAIDAAVATLR